jgi:DNA-binding beta-propeller fold protein YncE
MKRLINKSKGVSMKKQCVLTILTVSQLLCGFSCYAQERPLFKTGQKADIILGPYSTNASKKGFNHPGRVMSDGERLFVADTRNNRILIWNSIPTRDNEKPDVVVGQTGFSGNSSGGGRSKLNWPVGVYSDGTRLFVADTNNFRVLIWNKIPTRNGTPADMVLGKPDFDTVGEDWNDTMDAAWIGWPWDVCFDGKRLYVVSTLGGRVMIWEGLPTKNDQPADLLLGQKDFSNSVMNNERWNLQTPRSVSSDGNALAVGDYNGNKICIWSKPPTRNAQPPDVVLQGEELAKKCWYTIKGFFQVFRLGHAPLCLNNGKLMTGELHHFVWDSLPTKDNQVYDRIFGGDYNRGGGGWGLYYDGSKVYVANTNGNRILIYNDIPSDPGAPADIILGVKNPENNIFCGKKGFRSIGGIFSTGKKLLISSYDKRTVVYNDLPKTKKTELDTIISTYQWDEYYPFFVGRDNEPLHEPVGLHSDGIRLFLCDLKPSLVVYDRIPEEDNQWPDYFILTAEECRKLKIDLLCNVHVSKGKLFATSMEGKLLIWNSIPDGNKYQPPNVVISSPNMLAGVAGDGERLVVAELGRGVLIWNKIPTRNNQKPDLILPGTPIPFNGPQGVVIHEDSLIVADVGRHRICVYNTFPTDSQQPYDVVIGQNDLLSMAAGKSWTRMTNPTRLSFDGEYLWVGELKFGDRVLAFKADNKPGTPAAPSALKAAAVSNNQVDLTWTDNASNERGYILEYCEKGRKDYNVYGHLTYNTTSCSVEGLAKNKSYLFRITSFNSAGKSAGATVSAKTRNDKNSPPRAISKLHPASKSDEWMVGITNAFMLRWSGGDDDPGDKVTYDVYFGTDPNPPMLSQGQTQKLYFAGRGIVLPARTKFYWKVVAKDIEGESTESPVWSFTTGGWGSGNVEEKHITIDAAPGGVTNLTPGTYDFSPNEWMAYFFRVMLIAYPDDGYYFTGWEGDVPSDLRNDNPLHLPFDQDRSVRATFAPSTAHRAKWPEVK